MAGVETMRERWRSLGFREDTANPEIPVEPIEEGPTSGTFIGLGARFEGTLQLTGDFCIDSEFSGELSTDGTLVVGPSGSVEGNIHAREIIISGAVVGNVTARRLLTLRAGCRVHGDLETACLEVEPRAFFQGKMSMTSPQTTSRADSAAQESASDSQSKPSKPAQPNTSPGS